MRPHPLSQAFLAAEPPLILLVGINGVRKLAPPARKSSGGNSHSVSASKASFFIARTPLLEPPQPRDLSPTSGRGSPWCRATSPYRPYSTARSPGTDRPPALFARDRGGRRRPPERRKRRRGAPAGTSFLPNSLPVSLALGLFIPRPLTRSGGRGMEGLRARVGGDVFPGVAPGSQEPSPMLLVRRFLSPHHAAAEPPQPVPGWTPSGDGMSECHDQHEMLGVAIARRRLLAAGVARFSGKPVIDSPAVLIQ